MNKFCTKCGCKLEEGAKYCTGCGSEVVFEDNVYTSTNVKQNVNTNTNTKKGLPTWAIVLIVIGSVILLSLILVLVLFGVGYNIIKNSDIIDEVNNYINENTGSDVVGTIGDTLTDNEVNVTLSGVYKYDSIGEGYFVKVPDEGKEYLTFFFEVENISRENEFISYADFNGYVDGDKTSMEYVVGDVEGQSILSYDIEAGKKINGFIAFEIDKSWNEFEIYCNRNVFGNNGNLIFKVENTN